MVWVVSILVIILNIPFGYWRKIAKKFSWQWFLAVHFPVPIIIFLRIRFSLGWEWTTYPILVGAYISGQFIGGKWYRAWK